jgi:hypothetical protein
MLRQAVEIAASRDSRKDLRLAALYATAQVEGVASKLRMKRLWLPLRLLHFEAASIRSMIGPTSTGARRDNLRSLLRGRYGRSYVASYVESERCAGASCRLSRCGADREESLLGGLGGRLFSFVSSRQYRFDLGSGDGGDSNKRAATSLLFCHFRNRRDCGISGLVSCIASPGRRPDSGSPAALV